MMTSEPLDAHQEKIDAAFKDDVKRTECEQCGRWGVIDGQCRLCGHGHLKCRHCEKPIAPQEFEALVKAHMLFKGVIQMENGQVNSFCGSCSHWTLFSVDAVIEVAISKAVAKPKVVDSYKGYQVEVWQDNHPDCEGPEACWFAAAFTSPLREDDPGPELDAHAHTEIDVLAAIKIQIDERKE